MISIAVVSGKGGTGKTMFAGSIAHLLQNEGMYADCDVDAANFGILLGIEIQRTMPFFGSSKATIDPDLCTGCGLCMENCRFGAIIKQDVNTFAVDSLRCEGCNVCVYVCPENAVLFKSYQNGILLLSKTRYGGPLSHAELYPGSGVSGLLVSDVKKQAQNEIGNQRITMADGPPGIGCPVISTLIGVTICIIVTEPTISGLHDLKRILEIINTDICKPIIVINRSDLDPIRTEEIISWCSERNILVAGCIPYDPAVIDAVRKEIPVVSIESSTGDAIRTIWDTIKHEIEYGG